MFCPLDGVTTNGTSSVNSTSNNSASTGSYVPPQPQTGAGSTGQSNPLIPEIKIREWVWTAANPYRHPEIVVAVPVGWPVPTVHRLWFGTSMGMNTRYFVFCFYLAHDARHWSGNALCIDEQRDDNTFHTRTIMLAMISLSDSLLLFVNLIISHE